MVMTLQPAQSNDQIKILEALKDVMDPEVPALSVLDLGVVRRIDVTADQQVFVDVTPTYSGCPATALINAVIKAAIENLGYEKVTINTVLGPAWTTDWITDEGREKLKNYGIAPPIGSAPSGKAALFGEPTVVECPRCGSRDTEQVSEFGSTSCKAMYRCTACLEPFEYFKCI